MHHYLKLAITVQILEKVDAGETLKFYVFTANNFNCNNVNQIYYSDILRIYYINPA